MQGEALVRCRSRGTVCAALPTTWPATVWETRLFSTGPRIGKQNPIKIEDVLFRRQLSTEPPT
jgi:hypothetical protein